jgi:xanthine/uracil permease
MLVIYFGVIIVLFGVVGAIAARTWGRTKQSRQAIYTVASFLGVVVAGFVLLGWIRSINAYP